MVLLRFTSMVLQGDYFPIFLFGLFLSLEVVLSFGLGIGTPVTKRFFWLMTGYLDLQLHIIHSLLQLNNCQSRLLHCNGSSVHPIKDVVLTL